MNNDVSVNISYNETPHNGKPISMMKISPNGLILVTYSEDDKTFCVWKVESFKKVIESKRLDRLDDQHIIFCKNKESNIVDMCINDEKDKKILAYIDDEHKIKIIDMNNGLQEIKLNFEME
ncbi:9941_t:CDS:2, partial [Funneliformis geosporum]